MRPSLPEGHPTVTPYLKLPHTGRLLDFLKQAFGAEEIARLSKPDGTLLHAEVRLGNSLLKIHELPAGAVGKPCTLYYYADDVDAAFERAVDAGATPVFGPTDMYYGDRTACVTDVSGNDWWIATPVASLSLAEIQDRATAFLRERESG
jgi:PhnB protein